MKTTDANGREIDFDAAVNLMEDDIREAVHDDTPEAADPTTFLRLYAERHAERHAEKFGEDFAPYVGGAW